jgi:citrate synthase
MTEWGGESSLMDVGGLCAQGIRFRGYTIPECQKLLPKWKDGEQPQPEGTCTALSFVSPKSGSLKFDGSVPCRHAGLFWLLLTGEIPTAGQVKQLTHELHERAKHMPAHVLPLINSFPQNMHPMTQLSAAALALQTESKFAKEYEKGVNKNRYWEFVLEVCRPGSARCSTC